MRVGDKVWVEGQIPHAVSDPLPAIPCEHAHYGIKATIVEWLADGKRLVSFDFKDRPDEVHPKECLKPTGRSK